MQTPSPTPYSPEYLADNAAFGLPAHLFTTCPVPGCCNRKRWDDPVCEDCCSTETERMS